VYRLESACTGWAPEEITKFLGREEYLPSCEALGCLRDAVDCRCLTMALAPTLVSQPVEFDEELGKFVQAAPAHAHAPAHAPSAPAPPSAPTRSSSEGGEEEVSQRCTAPTSGPLPDMKLFGGWAIDNEYRGTYIPPCSPASSVCCKYYFVIYCLCGICTCIMNRRAKKSERYT
jgi:hypothetical protein